jgi:hypothetical protein
MNEVSLTRLYVLRAMYLLVSSDWYSAFGKTYSLRRSRSQNVNFFAALKPL